MRIGTKSVLVGAHQFLLHPLLLALGWWKAYGFAPVRIGVIRYDHHVAPGVAHLFGNGVIQVTRGVMTSLWDPRLWLVFIVHDLGYLGKPNMDGPEGETHPEFGAAIMRRLCGDVWGDFVLLHSRYYAKRLNRPLSPLCIADKWVIVLEPSWLYLPRVVLSGEVWEFVRHGQLRAAKMDEPYTEPERRGYEQGTLLSWHRATKSFMRRWIAEQAKGGADSWTPARHAVPRSVA
jgi:hypothetical protein